MIQRFAYDAYGIVLTGAQLTAAANAFTSLLYSGEAFNPTLGLQYLRARYYDPATGRFNRLDPFAGNQNDPQSLHKYAYVHGDPVNGWDPSGLMTLLDIMTLATDRLQIEVPTITAGVIAKAVLSRLIQGISFAYQLVYIPPLVKSLERLKQEMQPISPSVATNIQQTINKMEANLAVGAAVVSDPSSTPRFRNHSNCHDLPRALIA